MPTLAAISLLLPAMLGGMALLSLPIAAHLMSRRAQRQLVFPSIRLLAESSASQSSLFKIRRWVLLLLRCLAVALIVLAFAQPLWLEPGQNADPSAGTAVVLVLDHSASTAQESDGVAALATLKAAAERTLSGLAAGRDVANVVFAAASPRAAFDRLSPNLAALRNELARVEAVPERADLPAAVALAGQMLAGHIGPRRLVVISDMQDTNWHELVRGSALGASLPAGTKLTLVPLDAPAGENIAVTDAAVQPATPLPNQPARAVATLVNHSDREQPVTLEASLDGRSIGNQSLRLAPRQSRQVAFDVTFDGGGVHEVAFALPPDALPLDNRAHATVRTARRATVLLVHDDAPSEPGSAAYYLLRALSPRGDETDPFQVRRVASVQLNDEALRGARVAFVGQIGALPREALDALHRYTTGGGGVVFFAGDGPVAQNLAAWDALDPAGVVPFTVTALRDLSTRSDPLVLVPEPNPAPSDNALLREFDERSHITLGHIAFSRVWSAGAVKPDAAVMLRFSDGSPALAWRGVGAGRLVLAAFSPAQRSGDLGKFGLFVAMTQSLAYELAPRSTGGAAARVTQDVAFDPRPQEQMLGTISVTAPDGRDVPVQIETEAGQTTVRVLGSTQAGVYRLFVNNTLLDAQAVSLDPRESDLRRTPLRDTELALVGPGETTQIATASTTGPVLRTAGYPIWPWLVAAALGVLAMELALLGVWRR